MDHKQDKYRIVKTIYKIYKVYYIRSMPKAREELKTIPSTNELGIHNSNNQMRNI